MSLLVEVCDRFRRALPVDWAAGCSRPAAAVSERVDPTVDPAIDAHLDRSPELRGALRVACRAQIGLLTREGVLAVGDDVVVFVNKDVIDGVVEQRWPRVRVHAFERAERFGRPVITLLIADDELELEDVAGDVDALERALTEAADAEDPFVSLPSGAAAFDPELVAAREQLVSAIAAPHRGLVTLLAAREAALQLAAAHAERASAQRHRAALVAEMNARKTPVQPSTPTPHPAVEGPSRPLVGFLLTCAVVIVGVAVSQIGKGDEIPVPTPTPAPGGVTPEERPFVVRKDKVERPKEPARPPGAPHGLKNLVFGEPRAETLKKVAGLGSNRVLPPSVVEPPVRFDVNDPSSLLKPLPKEANQLVPGGHLEVTTTVGGVPAVCELWFAVQNTLSRMRCVLDPMGADTHRAVELSLIDALTTQYGAPDQAPEDRRKDLQGMPGMEAMAAMEVMAAMVEQFRDVRWRWTDDVASLDVHSKLTDLGNEIDIKPDAAFSRIELDNVAATHHKLLQDLRAIADQQRQVIEAKEAREAADTLRRLREESAQTRQQMVDDL